MPSFWAVSMRSFHIGPDSGGIRLEVSQRTNDCSRWGALSAKVWPIMPPIERPTKCTDPMSRASSMASTSSDSMSRL